MSDPKIDDTIHRLMTKPWQGEPDMPTDEGEPDAMGINWELITLTDYEILDVIVDVVEKAFQVRKIEAHTRTKRVSRARQVAMWLAREITQCSLNEIAERFERDHTTVLHAVRKVRGDRDSDSRFASVLQRLHNTVARECYRKSKEAENE